MVAREVAARGRGAPCPVAVGRPACAPTAAAATARASASSQRRRGGFTSPPSPTARPRAPAARRALKAAVAVPATSTAAHSSASRPQGSTRSIVQWKLCGLTTNTSTTLTASPSSRPTSAPAASQAAPSPATTPTTWRARQPQVRQQAEFLAPRQHLRRQAGGDADQADGDGHRLQVVGDGEAAVEDAQRQRLRRSARGGELQHRRVLAASARSACCTAAGRRRRAPATAPGR